MTLGYYLGLLIDRNGNNKGILGKIPHSYALEVFPQRLYGPRIAARSFCGNRTFSGTYGCGWDQKDQVIFFTVDENCGGSGFRKVVSTNLKPAICFTTSGVEVSVNFGVSQFVCDPRKYWEPYRAIERDIHNCLDSGICTFSVTNEEYFPQLMYHCKDCNLEGNLGMCEVCVKICHAGHNVTTPTAAVGFFCDCGSLTSSKQKTFCKALK